MHYEKSCVNVAEAKRHFSDLLGRVAYAKETIVITRRGKPMAVLTPPEDEGKRHLANARRWLDEDDEFFKIIEEVVAKGKYCRMIQPMSLWVLRDLICLSSQESGNFK